jgi:hypothetical protein
MSHNSLGEDFFLSKKPKRVKKKYKKHGKITTDEQEEDNIITWKTYKEFFGTYFGGWWFLVKINFVMICHISFKTYSDYLVGAWSQETDE